MIASIILALHLLGVIDAESATTFLYISGALLIVADIAVVSFGILSLNGLIAVFTAYVIQTGDNAVFGIPLDWPFLFGIAFIELAILVTAVLIILKFKGRRPTTGQEAMIGEKAVVLDWKGQEGNVRIHGEIWAARAEKSLKLKEKDKVTISEIEDLVLVIEA